MGKSIRIDKPNIGKISGNQISIEGVLNDGEIIDLHVSLDAIKSITINLEDNVTVKEKPLSGRLRGSNISVY